MKVKNESVVCCSFCFGALRVKIFSCFKCSGIKVDVFITLSTKNENIHVLIHKDGKTDEVAHNKKPFLNVFCFPSSL